MVTISNITEVLKYTNDYKAFIFDLDDTLYSEKEYVRSGYKEVAKLVPFIKDAEDQLWHYFEERKNAIDMLLLDNGIYTEELRTACISAYRYQTNPDIHLYDGVIDILESLRNTGHFIGIITDGRPEGQRSKIKALQLEKYVDAIIVTDELGGIQFRKPNLAAFIKMRESSNTDYSQMCYIGDNIEKDFIAPDKLGITAILYINYDGLYCLY